MQVVGFIADYPTPKFQLGQGAMYTLNSRDYKGVMVIVMQKDNKVRNGEKQDL